MPKFIDLTEKIFGRWKVIEKMNYKGKRGEILWLCECFCENKTRRIIKGGTLTSSRSTNCGCIRIEKFKIVARNNKKHNEYEIIGDNTMMGHSSNSNDVFYFDIDDYDKIKNYCWWINNWGYMYTTISNDLSSTSLLMHKLIYPTSNNKKTDHINRNKLDNKKSNLRTAVTKENGKNISKSFDNMSGFIGVDWVKRRNKWRARIVCDGIAIHLGVFINKEDAIIARLNAEKKYFKEFAPQKHLYEQYGIEQNKQSTNLD